MRWQNKFDWLKKEEAINRFVIAPDFPGFGYSSTPDPTGFSYTFEGYADFLERFTAAMNLTRYTLYLHDYGSQIGLRLAMKAPERIAALIIQNGDIYEDPKYETLKEYWTNPTPQGREKLGEAVSEEGFCDEFVGEVSEHLIERISPRSVETVVAVEAAATASRDHDRPDGGLAGESRLLS